MNDEPLREALAALAHEMWSGWMAYQFEKGALTTTWDIYERRKVETFHLPHQFVERWQRQMNTPYAELSESEKEGDRVEADKMLAIVRGKCMCGCDACKYCERLLEASA